MSKKSLFFNIAIFLILFVFYGSSTIDANASQIIYQDNFNSYPEGTVPPGWDITADPGINLCKENWSIHNGMLGISINNDPSCTTNLVPNSILWGNLISNYSIDFDMQFVNGTDHNFIYKYIDQNTPFYEIHFQSPGDFVLSVPQNSIYNVNPPGIYPNGLTYHVKFIINGKNIQVFIDGVQERDITLQDALPQGKIALRAGTGADPSSETWFDNIVVTNLGSDLSVPLFKQTSSPWNIQEYDGAHIWNPSNPTINAWGCAMTSAAMIFRYYGINELPDGTVLDPGTLNTWLKNQPDGYVETGWVNWIALSRLSKLATSINHITSFDALEYQRTQGSNTTQLTTDLSNSQPDILEEPGHFIVATGINGNTFDVNDPYYSRSTLNDGYNSSFLSLGQYIPAHTDLSYIMLVTDPKTTITVTNKNGTSVGSSFIQSPIINPSNSSQKNSSIKIYYLPKPDNGNYTVSATNANNLIKMTSYLYDQQGNPEIQQLSGFTNVSITLKFNKSNSSNSSAKKIVTFDNTIQDIKTAANLHLINAALAASLVTIVQNAKIQSTKHADIAKTILEGGIKILDGSKHYPILIAQNTYTILLEDFIVLQNTL